MSRHRPRAVDYTIVSGNFTHGMRFPFPRDPTNPEKRTRSQWSDPLDAAVALRGLAQGHRADVLLLQEMDEGAFRSGADLRTEPFDPSTARSDVSQAELARRALQQAGRRPAAVFGPAFEISARAAIRDGEDVGLVGNVIAVADGSLTHPVDLARPAIVVDLSVAGRTYDATQPQRYEGRSMTVARWTPSGGRPPILLATTTLELKDPEVKEAQLARCRSVLDDLSRRTGLPVVLGGHLNVKPYDLAPPTGVPELGRMTNEWRVLYPTRGMRTPEAEGSRTSETTHRAFGIVHNYLVHHNAAERPNVTVRSTKRGYVASEFDPTGARSVSQHRPVVHTIEAVYADERARASLLEASVAPESARGRTLVLSMPGAEETGPGGLA